MHGLNVGSILRTLHSRTMHDPWPLCLRLRQDLWSQYAQVCSSIIDMFGRAPLVSILRVIFFSWGRREAEHSSNTIRAQENVILVIFLTAFALYWTCLHLTKLKIISSSGLPVAQLSSVHEILGRYFFETKEHCLVIGYASRLDNEVVTSGEITKHVHFNMLNDAL